MSKEFIKDLRLLCADSNPNPHARIKADSCQTVYGRWLYSSYVSNSLKFDRERWHNFFTCILELVKAFIEIKNRRSIWINWWRVGKSLFQKFNALWNVLKENKLSKN